LATECNLGRQLPRSAYQLHHVQPFTSLINDRQSTSNWHNVCSLDTETALQVLDLIHHIDIVDALISEGVSSSDDWVWVKQLRYYRTGRTGATALVVKMADAALDYSWEYQGNAPKLVYTPLTDRCYLTLTQVTRLTCLLLPQTVLLLKLGMCCNLQVSNARTAVQLFG